MGFEITGFQYDETRQISATQYTNVGTNGRMGSKLNAPDVFERNKRNK